MTVNQKPMFHAVVFILTTIILLATSAWSSDSQYNVPLDHPVYQFIDMLPLQPITEGVSVASRPYSEKQVCVLLGFAKKNCSPSQKNLIDYYLAEFNGQDSIGIKKADISLDGRKIHAFPRIATTIAMKDSGFTKQGFDALATDSLSSTVEGYNKTLAGGRLYADIAGFLSYFEGAIITEYASKEQWKKIDEPQTGRNYTTIGAETGEPGNFIGYDNFSAYVKSPLKNIDITAGFDRLSWGYAGSSGLFMSGEGRPFPMVKASKSIGRLDYTFVVGRLTGDSYAQKRILYAKHITYSPADWIAFGLSDGIISSERTIKPVYFLPFTPFYFVEHYIGGEDNRIMAFDAQCNIRKNVALYGELYIDEISNLLGFITNNDANDVWAGLCGIKWHNPLAVLPSSLLKAEFVQLEPWVYTRYTREGRIIANNPVDFGRPLGNQMGPHSRSLSLNLSGMLSEKIRGSFGVTQYLKGAGPGSTILEGNDFVWDTVDGYQTNEHQLFSEKEYRFKNFSRERTAISVAAAYTFEHWLQAECFGDFVREAGERKGNFFRTGVEVRMNY